MPRQGVHGSLFGASMTHVPLLVPVLARSPGCGPAPWGCRVLPLISDGSDGGPWCRTAPTTGVVSVGETTVCRCSWWLAWQAARTRRRRQRAALRGAFGLLVDRRRDQGNGLCEAAC